MKARTSFSGAAVLLVASILLVRPDASQAGYSSSNPNKATSGVPKNKADVVGDEDIERVTKIWKEAIHDVVHNNPRLAEFADAAWNIHCRHPNKPSHQHLLQFPTLQKCDAPFPGLVPVRPLHDIRDITECDAQKLESKWTTVKEELDAYLIKTATARSAADWKTSTTKLCDDTNGFQKLALQDDEGNPTTIGRLHFPKTLALLKDAVGPFSLAPRPINIHRQAPESGLAPHSDNMNCLLTVHLGLEIPTKGDCIFFIGDGIQYRWKAGELVVADTSFVHSTINKSPDESRYVLSFCVWHPHLSREERQGIVKLHSILQSIMSTSTSTSRPP